MDTLHAQHNSVPAYGWFLKGEETFLKSNAGRSRVSINGAFCLHDKSVVYRQDERINGVSNVAYCKPSSTSAQRQRKSALSLMERPAITELTFKHSF